MSDRDAAERDRRVLFLAPTGRDAATTRELLSEAGIPHQVCLTFETLVRETSLGAAAILIPEEAAISPDRTQLCEVLEAQPPWSDLPVLVLTRSGADAEELGAAVTALGNVALLERPMRVATLLSAVRTALRARDRQYEIREHLVERELAEEALRRADRRKDEFLATLGHELRNPLAPLLTGLQMLEMPDRDEAAIQSVTAVMKRQVNHLIRLVNDLLEVSRITRGFIEVRREPLDLAFVLRAAIDVSRPALEAGRHELTVELPADPVTIAGDPVRLTQVFANLLNNAAKYTDAGGHVWVTAVREPGCAVVSVRDDGIGIPPDQLGSVFDLFTQFDRSTRHAQGGLGIGLTLVRSLVTMHGGRVEAQSAGLGAGSEFRVELPVLAGSRLEDRTAASPEAFPPRRVLVVDDNCDAVEMLGTLLTVLGATVATVQDGRAALRALDSFEPDVVLLDIGMPDMDGYEVARRIRGTPDHADVLLIALTGWGQENDQRRSRAAGFDHHIIKPVDIEMLRDLLAPDPRRAGAHPAGRRERARPP